MSSFENKTHAHLLLFRNTVTKEIEEYEKKRINAQNYIDQSEQELLVKEKEKQDLEKDDEEKLNQCDVVICKIKNQQKQCRREIVDCSKMKEELQKRFDTSPKEEEKEKTREAISCEETLRLFEEELRQKDAKLMDLLNQMFQLLTGK